MVVLGVVRRLLRGLLREGIGYKKAGVALLDPARPEELQADLFGPTVVGNERLMATMDRINQKFGRALRDSVRQAGRLDRPGACGRTCCPRPTQLHWEPFQTPVASNAFR